MEFKEKLGVFQEKIGFFFDDPSHLEIALTHRSFVRESHEQAYGLHNERLEYLGDAVLKLIISVYLFQLYPAKEEGILTKIRSQLVSDRFLAVIGRDMSIGEYMRFSKTEARNGGAQRESILGNAIEALLGACFLDKGYNATEAFFIGYLKEHMAEFLHSTQLTDYKSQLQEHLQKFYMELPQYQLINEEGPDHNKSFTVDVSFQFLDEHYVFHGVGKTIKKAEQHAARLAMEEMELMDAES